MSITSRFHIGEGDQHLKRRWNDRWETRHVDVCCWFRPVHFYWLLVGGQNRKTHSFPDASKMPKERPVAGVGHSRDSIDPPDGGEAIFSAAPDGFSFKWKIGRHQSFISRLAPG